MKNNEKTATNHGDSVGDRVDRGDPSSGEVPEEWEQRLMKTWK